MTLLSSFFDEIEEVLPHEIRKQKNFRLRRENIFSLHFPVSKEDWERSRNELAYEELFMIQYRGIERKLQSQQATTGKAPAIPLNAERITSLLTLFPFVWTNKQKIVLFQILKDMEENYAMRRLLQ